MKVIPLLYFKNGTTIQACGTALTNPNPNCQKLLLLFRQKHSEPKDVYGGCLSLFYLLFQYLEVNHLLDADDDVHIWCLHYV